jgi:hypothetical protein
MVSAKNCPEVSNIARVKHGLAILVGNRTEYRQLSEADVLAKAQAVEPSSVSWVSWM